MDLTRFRLVLQGLTVVALIVAIATFAYAGSTGRYWLALLVIVLFSSIGVVNVWHVWRKNQRR